MEVSMKELREIKDLLKKLVELLENEKNVNPPNQFFRMYEC